jgi:D-alanyl-D-alanine carboxypeptidase
VVACASLLRASDLGWLWCAALLACEQAPRRDVEGAPPAAVSAAPSAVAPASTETRELPVTNAVTTITPSEPESPCNEQAAQPFLVRAHFDSFMAAGGTTREWKQVLERAVRYRTEEYGYVKGYGDEAWSSTTPAAEARVVTFFGVSVSVHRRIVPALACVETAIRARCASEPYQPYVLSGLRRRNTYVSGEISNHVYGIALDVDPLRNPCCGCIGEWRESERCQNDKSKLERMEMPLCWVKEFERFGFYWLGHDKIEDTMHFEFLAEPSRIHRTR